MPTIIDEAAARAAKRAMSFSDYSEGSATAEYNALCAEADAIAAAQKAKVHPQHHEKIDRLLVKYKGRMADNINARNRNAASCPSVMIAGASNFPAAKKNRQNARETTLMGEYDEISGLLERIRSVGTGGIQSGEADALERLRDKLDDLQDVHEEMIARNKHWQNHGTMAGYDDISAKDAQRLDAEILGGYSWERQPVPAYALQNSSAEIRRIKGRIDALTRVKERPPEDWSFDGGHAECDAGPMKLRLFFDAKPPEEIRTALKDNGFRWAPSEGAWQRMLNGNAIAAAKRIVAPIANDDA